MYSIFRQEKPVLVKYFKSGLQNPSAPLQKCLPLEEDQRELAQAIGLGSIAIFYAKKCSCEQFHQLPPRPL